VAIIPLPLKEMNACNSLHCLLYPHNQYLRLRLCRLSLHHTSDR
jgi:hypothetical protein